MATVETTRYVDDLTGGDADETVGFGLDGDRFEIDLSSVNAERLRSELAPFLAVARTADTPGARRARARAASAPARAGRSVGAPKAAAAKATAPKAAAPEDTGSEVAAVPKATVSEAVAAPEATAPEVTGSEATGPKAAGPAAASRAQNHAVRAWARENGFTVSERGRIPSEVLAAYHRERPADSADAATTSTERAGAATTNTEPTNTGTTSTADTGADEPAAANTEAGTAAPGPMTVLFSG